MKILLLKLKGVKPGTEHGERRLPKAPPTKETGKNSITLASTEREVLIMSLFVLSLVQQIVGASLLLKQEGKHDDDRT